MKNITIGIDIGGSMTKICGFRGGQEKLPPQHVRANDPLASVYGAFGKFTSENGIELEDIEKVMVTGVGSSFIIRQLYNLPTESVPETQAIGLGGLYLSGLERAVVVSMGTGTAIVMADGEGQRHLGGTGIGGGTLVGLSRRLLNMDSMENVVELAKGGDLAKVDLRLSKMTKKDILPGLPGHATASNFGKRDDLTTNADVALGLINMIFETVGMMSVFAANRFGINDIVLVGRLAGVAQAEPIFAGLGGMFDISFRIPPLAEYGPAIGAALKGIGG